MASEVFKIPNQNAARQGGRESTIIMIKPEEVQAGRAWLITDHIRRFCDENGLEAYRAPVMLTREILERHYFGRGEKYVKATGVKVAGTLEKEGVKCTRSDIELGERMLRNIVDGYTDKEAHLIVVRGHDAIQKVRSIKGSTTPSESEPGTIRKKFDTGMKLYEAIANGTPMRNIVHIPDNAEEADHDLLVFSPLIDRLERLAILERV
ncbi:MAG: hypothetical protein KGH98_02295 [Candidatus Micrarchaeota archaeon]|nr:hypothetical protein [Candidatus Micrarchaeota archaeon]